MPPPPGLAEGASRVNKCAKFARIAFRKGLLAKGSIRAHHPKIIEFSYAGQFRGIAFVKIIGTSRQCSFDNACVRAL